MSKTIHLYLPRQLEKAIFKVLEFDDRFESESTFIRYCVKRILKEDYYNLLFEVVKDEEEK